MVIQVIQTVFGDGFDRSFSTVYLGNIEAHLLVQDRFLLKILLAASKKAVTRKWLQAEPPTETHWIDIVTDVTCMYVCFIVSVSFKM